jgi:hypothetical protein
VVSKNTFQLADAKRLRFLMDDDGNVEAMQVLERDGRTTRLERTS